MIIHDTDCVTQNRERLVSMSESNRRTMSAIEESIMAVSLDHYMPNADQNWPSDSREEVKSHLHNIRSGPNARNRWFDKPLTLIVEPNSRAGLTGEHSPCDALLPSVVADFALAQAMDSQSLPTSTLR